MCGISTDTHSLPSSISMNNAGTTPVQFKRKYTTTYAPHNDLAPFNTGRNTARGVDAFGGVVFRLPTA